MSVYFGSFAWLALFVSSRMRHLKLMFARKAGLHLQQIDAFGNNTSCLCREGSCLRWSGYISPKCMQADVAEMGCHEH